MKYSEIKRRVVDHNGSRFYDRRFCIYNEFGPIAFVWSDCEQNALDEAVDSGHMDSERMSDEDHAEYAANGWGDSYILAGNASEPFWSHYLGIAEIPSPIFRP